MSLPVFPFATAPDIVRSHQKDDYYVTMLNKKVEDVVALLVGPSSVLRQREELRLVTRIVYYAINTLRGIQTLGEEYCDIQLVSSSGEYLASPAQRLMLVVIGAVCPLVWQLRRYWSSGFASQLEHFGLLAPVLKALHLAAFYFDASYYHMSKRIVGLRYMFRKTGYPKRSSYAPLGILLLMQGLARVVMLSRHFKEYQAFQAQKNEIMFEKEAQDEHDMKVATEAQASPRCALCFDARSHPTATTCGHVFCWKCITEWAQHKTWCPLCRNEIKPQELIPLYAFR